LIDAICRGDAVTGTVFPNVNGLLHR